MPLILVCTIGALFIGYYSYNRWKGFSGTDEQIVVSLLLLIIGLLVSFFTSLVLGANLEYIKIETYSDNLLPLEDSSLYARVYMNPDDGGFVIYLVEGEENHSYLPFASYEAIEAEDNSGQPMIRIYESQIKDPWYWLYAILPYREIGVVLSTPEDGVQFIEIQKQAIMGD